MEEESTPNNPIRVLLVDDESLIRKSIRRVFAPLPQVAMEDFEHGAAAVARARDILFDVALLDLQMPHMNGLEVARELRTVQPQLRIVFMTANPASPLSADAERFMGGGVLSKPWTTGDLVKAVVGRP